MTHPRIKLYDYGLAYYPARTRLMLLEKGFNPKDALVEVNILAGENIDIEFMKKCGGTGTLPLMEIFNPEGAVEKTLGQSRLISDWLDAFDGKRLGSSDPTVKLDDVDDVLKEFQEWDGNVYSAGFSPENSKGARDMLSAFRLATAEARLKESPSELQKAYQEKVAAMKEQSTEEDYQNCAQQLRTILDKSELRLASSEYVCGSSYSAADALLTTIVWRVKSTGRAKDEIDGRPNLCKWWERVKARPSFDQAFSRYPYQKNPIWAVAGLLPKLLWFKATGRV